MRKKKVELITFTKYFWFSNYLLSVLESDKLKFILFKAALFFSMWNGDFIKDLNILVYYIYNFKC